MVRTFLAFATLLGISAVIGQALSGRDAVERFFAASAAKQFNTAMRSFAPGGNLSVFDHNCVTYLNTTASVAYLEHSSKWWTFMRRNVGRVVQVGNFVAAAFIDAGFIPAGASPNAPPVFLTNGALVGSMDAFGLFTSAWLHVDFGSDADKEPYRVYVDNFFDLFCSGNETALINQFSEDAVLLVAKRFYGSDGETSIMQLETTPAAYFAQIVAMRKQCNVLHRSPVFGCGHIIVQSTRMIGMTNGTQQIDDGLDVLLFSNSSGSLKLQRWETYVDSGAQQLL
jgi:hypothetical protein